MMEQDIIDLGHLTDGERQKILAVINADQELRIQRLRLSDTQSNTEFVTPSHLPDKNSSGIETQEVHIKLESDHSLASELLRRSLTAVPIQKMKHSETHKKSNTLPAKKSPPRAKSSLPSTSYQVLVKSSSTESLSSTYSAHGGKGDYRITGKIKLEMWYGDEQLFVHVMKAKGLATAKREGVSNPYVKIYLLPDRDKQSKRKTSVHRKTTNPEFDETLKIKIGQCQLNSRTLWLSVWDWDRFGRNQFLGEIRLPLSSVDLTIKASRWYTLQDEPEDENVKSVITSKLCMSLKYTPLSKVIGTLHIAIHHAEDLPAMNKHDLTDATVKLYLLPHQSSSAKRKTKVINRNLNPVWNEEFTYENVYVDDLKSRRVLEVTVWDYDRRGSNDFIGGVRIGPDPESVQDKVCDWMDSTDDESAHWKAMLEQPGEWVRQVHVLRLDMKPASQTLTKKFNTAISTCNPHEHTLPTCDISNNYSFSKSFKQKPSHRSDQMDPKELPKPVEDSENKVDTDGLNQKRSQLADGYDITGRVSVGVYYRHKHLHVHIDRAKGLAAADSNGYSDPYIKTYLLLPDGGRYSKQKTNIKKKTLDPIYNETFMHRVSKMEVDSMTLLLSVWDWDRFGGNQFLGEVRLPLNSLNLIDTSNHWHTLQDKNPGNLKAVQSSSLTSDCEVPNQPVECTVNGSELSHSASNESEGRDFIRSADQGMKGTDQASPSKMKDIDITGEVLMGVYYKNGELCIHIDRASRLAAADSNGYSDPYIKTYLLPDKDRHTKQKTSVKKKTLDPIYNETLKYKVLQSDLTSQTLWVSVWDWDRFSSNDFLGEIYLPLSSLDLNNVENQWYKLQNTDNGGQGTISRTSTNPTILSHPTCGVGSDIDNLQEVSLEDRPLPAADVQAPQSEDSFYLTHTESLSSCSSTSSLTSVYSEAGGKGDCDITGAVLLGVFYKDGRLHVHIDRASGLAAADSNGYSNPYVKTYLLPDKDRHTKQKTSVKKKTLDPVYNETLQYDISESELRSRTLWLSMWDWDRFGINQFLGEIYLSFSSLELNDSQSQWYHLQDKGEGAISEIDNLNTAELNVGLKYLPSEGAKDIGTLVVDIKEGKDVAGVGGKSTKSVVKLYLLPNQQSSGKRKTNVIRDSGNPVWEEKFTYDDVSMEELSHERVLEVSVWNQDETSGDHTFIGGLRLGPAPGSAAKHKDWMDSIGDEVTHWEDMLACSGEWVEQWHTLRGSLAPRDDIDLYTHFSIVNED